MTDGDSPTSDSFNLKSVLTSCSDVDWDTRRKGCVSLKEVADDPRRLAEVRAGSEAIAKCIADRMDDRNHKVLLKQTCRCYPRVLSLSMGCPVSQVVQAGLDAAMHFLRIHPGSFKPAMDTLLFPKFMMHVHALAAATATKADELITVILSMYPHADVILWAVKTLINTAEVLPPECLQPLRLSVVVTHSLACFAHPGSDPVWNTGCHVSHSGAVPCSQRCDRSYSNGILFSAQRPTTEAGDVLTSLLSIQLHC